MGSPSPEVALQGLPQVLLFSHRHDPQLFQAEAGPDPEDGFPALRGSPLPSGSALGQCLHPDRVPVEKEAPGTDEEPGKDDAFGKNMGGSYLYPCPCEGKIEGEEERAVGQSETDRPCHR